MTLISLPDGVVETIRAVKQLEHALGLPEGSAADRRLERKVREIRRVQDYMEKIEAAERIRNQVEAIERARVAVWHAIGAGHQRAMEALEHINKYVEMVRMARLGAHTLRSGMARTMRRGQDGATGTGKKSASKKSAKSAGGGSGDGGGGDGDGDGPPHTLLKNKKRRPQQNRSTSSQHPSSVSTDAIVAPQFPPPQSSPPQLPPPRRTRALAYLSTVGMFVLAFITEGEMLKGLAIVMLAIVTLSAIGHPDVAKQLLTSKVVPALIARLLGKPQDD